MPVSKDAMRNMVRYIESKMPVYPSRFHDISAVKAYIINTSAADALESGHITYEVMDSVTSQVAIRAYQNGEFYLDITPPDRRALRNAIEVAMVQILPQIGSWPNGFTHVQEVKTFVAVVCAPIVDRLSFPTLANEVFKGYVLFQTARQAWEDRKYEMKVVPDSWHRKALAPPRPVPSQVPKSLTDTISLNISHLLPLLHSWPALFLDLNAARNYVSQICADNRFGYTYHTDVEDRKLRCIVHFTAAKYAWEAGKFRLDEEGERVRIQGSGGGREVRREGFGVSVKAYGVGTGRPVGRAEAEAADVEEGGIHEMSNDGAGASPTSFLITLDAFEMLDGQGDQEIEMLEFGNEMSSVADGGEESVGWEELRCDSAADIEDVEKVEKMVDPFKDLLSDLRRTTILKAAFE